MELVKQDYVAIPAIVVTGTEQLKGTKDRLKRAALARIALGYQELSLAVGETRSRLTIQDVEEGLRQADVQIFDNKGRFLLAFGNAGNEAGEFWLPAGLFIAEDRIYVADSYNKRVQVFQFLGGG